MSQTMTTSSSVHRSTNGRRAVWLREPMLHFFFFGVALFAVDAWLLRQTDADNLIVLRATHDEEIRDIFRGSAQRDPTDDEMQVLRRRWFDNELLYREGLAMELHRGDEGIRERVIFKALNVVQADIKVEKPDQETLREWFESHRTIYDEPPRLTFEEAVVRGASITEVENLAARLNSDPAGDPRAELRIHRGRPVATVIPAWGEQFAAMVGTMPLGQWQGVDSKAGPRAIRVTERSAAKAAEFDAVRSEVLKDWRDARAAELREQAVRALESKYVLVVEAEKGL
jgi:hypothetical protein